MTQLQQMETHQACVLLKNYFLIPKLQYVPRTLPAYHQAECLDNFDTVSRDAVIRVSNVPLEDWSWNEAPLPVSHEGLSLLKNFHFAFICFELSSNESG